MGNFDPASFDQDIYVREVRGLGQGKGFVEVGRRSALYDPLVVSKVKPRLLQLVKLLLSKGLLTWQEVGTTVGPLPSSEGEDSARLRAGTQTLQAELEELKSDVEQIAYDLGVAGGFGLADGLTPVEMLQSASSGIGQEFQAAQEALEEAAAEIFRIMDVQDKMGDQDPQEKLQTALGLLRNDYAAAEG